MKIEKDTVVTLKYKVADAQGKLIEASPEPRASRPR
jgi:FKBP-type peptidyl-prolyl cis-trans isomerase SlyD